MLIVSVVWGGSSNSNNHEHGRIISVSELFLTVTAVTAGSAIGFSFCSGKGNEKQIQMEHESKDLRFTKQLYTWS
jgi:hypothetical protein